MKICENGVIRDATAEELAQNAIDREHARVEAIKQLREERNLLLSKSDWTQAGDVPQAPKDKWAAYRQALRDVPQQAGFPDNIQWPVKPE
jgi:hypothetical protein